MANSSRMRVFSMNFDQACEVILWFQNIDQAVFKCFILYRETAAKMTTHIHTLHK